MQVCVPTTPAQVFHMLRRQMLRRYRKPLIVMTPEEPAAPQGSGVVARRARQRRVPDGDRRDGEARREEGHARARVLAARCTTSSWRYRREHKIDDIAIVRLEQQYPFPHAEFTRRRSRSFRRRRKSCGAGGAAEPGRVVSPARLPARAISPDAKVLAYAGRPISASPAVGYATKHLAEQKQLVEDAFAPQADVAARWSWRTDAQLTLRNSKRAHCTVRQVEHERNRSQSPAAAGIGCRRRRWSAGTRRPGEAVARDENLIDIETDKVVLELPAPGDGVLVEFARPDGATVDVATR